MRVIRIFEVIIVGVLGFLLFLHDRIVLFPMIWEDSVRIQDYVAVFDEKNVPESAPEKVGKPMYPYLFEEAFKRLLMHISLWCIVIALWFCWVYLPGLISIK